MVGRELEAKSLLCFGDDLCRWRASCWYQSMRPKASGCLPRHPLSSTESVGDTRKSLWWNLEFLRAPPAPGLDIIFSLLSANTKNVCDSSSWVLLDVGPESFEWWRAFDPFAVTGEFDYMCNKERSALPKNRLADEGTPSDR